MQNLRKNYRLARFDLSDLAVSPFDQFRVWFQDVLNAKIDEPNAMAIATARKDAKPSIRMVLLKQFDESGLIFFTNYESRKARELLENPYAACNFFWKELERQICIEGKVEKVTEEVSQRYFNSRPRGSQLGTWSSRQDSVIASREVLEKEYEKREKQFRDKDIPLPEFWGGFLLRPVRFEFWQGREDRLHDRFQYSLMENKWAIDRLSP